MNAKLKEYDLEMYFPAKRGWRVIEKNLSSFDHRSVLLGTPLRCIDPDFGMTPNGYYPDKVPSAPAWPGAIDGVFPYMPGKTLEEKINEANKRIEALGLKPANHGDYLKGKKGCKFRAAYLEGRFEGLPPITDEEYQVLVAKSGVHYTQVYRPADSKEAEAFVLNDHDFTFVLPNGGMYYPVETWLGRMLGIPYELALKMIERTGELLIPDSSKRKLFVATF